ncbi:MAG: hypothetical protein AB1425_07490 [Actinomycetota bacterium]
MIATEKRGHYEVLEVPFGKDYVWVPEPEDAKTRDRVLRPWLEEYEGWERETRAHPDERQEWAEIQALV